MCLDTTWNVLNYRRACKHFAPGVGVDQVSQNLRYPPLTQCLRFAPHLHRETTPSKVRRTRLVFTIYHTHSRVWAASFYHEKKPNNDFLLCLRWPISVCSENKGTHVHDHGLDCSSLSTICINHQHFLGSEQLSVKASENCLIPRYFGETYNNLCSTDICTRPTHMPVSHSTALICRAPGKQQPPERFSRKWHAARMDATHPPNNGAEVTQM